jgi:adenylate kinase
MLAEDGKKIDIVVNLETPEAEILERISNRRICTNSDCKAVYNLVLAPSKVPGICDKCGSKLYQREDDKVESAKNRLEVYKKETAPVAKYYAKTGALFSTVLSQSVNRMKDEVAKDVIEYLREEK